MILRKLEVVTDVCVHVALSLMVMASVSGGQEIEVVDMAVAVMAAVETGTAVVGGLNRVVVAVMADVETGTAVVGAINRV